MFSKKKFGIRPVLTLTLIYIKTVLSSFRPVLTLILIYIKTILSSFTIFNC